MFMFLQKTHMYVAFIVVVYLLVVFPFVFVFHSLAAALSSQANRDSYKPLYSFKGLCTLCVVFITVCIYFSMCATVYHWIL